MLLSQRKVFKSPLDMFLHLPYIVNSRQPNVTMLWYYNLFGYKEGKKKLEHVAQKGISYLYQFIENWEKDP